MDFESRKLCYLVTVTLSNDILIKFRTDEHDEFRVLERLEKKYGATNIIIERLPVHN